MRNDIHIVLDSIAVAEETPLRDDPRCHVVPLLVRHGDTEWVDGEKSLQEMFAMVEASGQLPKTSQPAIGRFLDVFTELAADGKKVIAIMLDGVLSGTVQTARLAARQVMSEIPGSDIRVFDSLTAACPISGMAMEVLAYAETGATMDELEEYLKGPPLIVLRIGEPTSSPFISSKSNSFKTFSTRCPISSSVKRAKQSRAVYKRF